MRRSARVLLMATLMPFAVAAAGCSSMDSFDPENAFNFLNPEKPLPGHREAVFPGGVPGIPHGVPQELVKGNEPPPDQTPMQASEPLPAPTQQTASRTSGPMVLGPQAAVTSEPPAKPKPKYMPKPKVAAVKPSPKPTPKPTAVSVQPASIRGSQPILKPWPTQTQAKDTSEKKKEEQDAKAPWPTTQKTASQPWPTQQTQSPQQAYPWPKPPSQ